MPLPPLLNYSSVSYGIGEFSVEVQWQTPSDDHGAVDNYTLTLYRDEIIFEMSLLNSNIVEHYIYLNYSTTTPLESTLVIVLGLEIQHILKVRGSEIRI